MIVVDTGPLIAVANARDTNHGRCKKALSEATERLIVPPTAVAEATYYLQGRAGTNAELALLALITTGYLEVAQIELSDFERASELVNTSRSLNLGTSDAMVVAIAERLGTPKAMTTDQRHFNVVRPRHVEAFELLP